MFSADRIPQTGGGGGGGGRFVVMVMLLVSGTVWLPAPIVSAMVCVPVLVKLVVSVEPVPAAVPSTCHAYVTVLRQLASGVLG